jgi:hypothetical protein
MQSQFKELYAELQRDFPNNDSKLTEFPSGAAMLHLKIGAETFIMAYYSNVGVGISRMSTATFGWEGYENPFDSFEEAKTYLLSLLKKG